MEHNHVNRLLLVEKVLLLKSLNMFKDTPENILAELAPLMKEKEYEQGAVIFNEGETGDCMYIIQLGSVRIHKGTTTLAVLKELEVFGELSLLDDSGEKQQKRQPGANGRDPKIIQRRHPRR